MSKKYKMTVLKDLPNYPTGFEIRNITKETLKSELDENYSSECGRKLSE